MRLLKGLAVAVAVGAWIVIVIGGYVTATSSGLSCRNVVDCGVASEGAAIEISHRLAGWVEGFLVLALVIVVLRSYRTWQPVRNMTLTAFVLIAGQSVVGMLSVYSGFEAAAWYPVLVTFHLGLATLFLAVSVLNASAILRGTPPLPAPLPFTPSESPVESG